MKEKKTLMFIVALVGLVMIFGLMACEEKVQKETVFPKHSTTPIKFGDEREGEIIYYAATSHGGSAYVVRILLICETQIEVFSLYKDKQGVVDYLNVWTRQSFWSCSSVSYDVTKIQVQLGEAKDEIQVEETQVEDKYAINKVIHKIKVIKKVKKLPIIKVDEERITDLTVK